MNINCIIPLKLSLDISQTHQTRDELVGALVKYKHPHDSRGVSTYSTHNDGTINKLPQEQKLEYGSIVHGEDTNVCIVTYIRSMCSF